MSDDLAETLRRIARENQEARAKFAGLAARTFSAVVAGDWNAFGEIIKEAGNDGNSGEGNLSREDKARGPNSMEA